MSMVSGVLTAGRRDQLENQRRLGLDHISKSEHGRIHGTIGRRGYTDTFFYFHYVIIRVAPAVPDNVYYRKNNTLF